MPLPTGSGSRSTRTPWSAALGLFAAIPIAYLVLVVLDQIVKQSRKLIDVNQIVKPLLR